MKQNLIFIPLILVLVACGAEPEAGKAAAVRVDGEHAILAEPDKASFLKLAAVEADQGGTLRLPGRLVWNEEKTVRVFPQLGGRVQKITVDIGTPVKAGQPLATLSSPDYGQALADARKAAAEAQVANQAVERSRQLREAGVIAEKDWQQAEAAAVAARAEAARASHRLAGLGGDGDGSYVLRSPLAGIVVERNLNPGMEFRPEQAAPPLFVVTDPASLWLQIDAGEADIAYLKAGQALQVEVKQYPGEHFAGVIRHVADFVDPASRSIKVRAEVANTERRLKGEMFASALVAVPASPLLRVPATAVFLLGDQRYVFIDEGRGSFLRQRIAVAAERDGWVTVSEGLKDGQRVVVEGNLHLLKYFKAQAGADKAAK
jgi:cobalt-zinc-cadmium efflux system membrane fusion protein